MSEPSTRFKEQIDQCAQEIHGVVEKHINTLVAEEVLPSDKIELGKSSWLFWARITNIFISQIYSPVMMKAVDLELDQSNPPQETKEG